MKKIERSLSIKQLRPVVEGLLFLGLFLGAWMIVPNGYGNRGQVFILFKFMI